MKRYAIVRVDEGCPIGQSVFKEIELQNVCNASKNCSSCLIGDTKEQLVNKIITVLKREKKGWFYISERDIATKIVEFLGVE
jgi:hypothetical protein